MKKKLPKFKDEDDERKFWATADSTEYVDWRSGKAQETRAPQTISKDDLVEALSRDDPGSKSVGESPRRFHISFCSRSFWLSLWRASVSHDQVRSPTER
jgi:hypothetical protein